MARNIQIGLQVFRTDGIRRKPDSSIKTRWAASLAAFFLPGARRSVSIRRWPPRCAPGPAVPASGGSSPAGAGACPRDCDGSSPPGGVRSARQSAAWSTTPSGSRGPWPLGPGAERGALSVSRSAGGPAGCWLGLQRLLPAGLQGIAPPQHTAGVAADSPRDLMQGQLLLEERDHPAPTLFQRFRRSMRSHGDTSFQDVSIVLHYLCGSQ